MLFDAGTTPNRSSRRWNRWDAINIAILALLNLAMRCPFFNIPILHIDDAEYLAKGAFAQETGQSAFAFPGMPYTVEAFKISAEFFGRYNPAPARVAIAIIAWAVAVFIYRWLARDTSRVLAMAIATLFVAWNFIFEGAELDREWPCVLAILAGAHLFMMAQRRADRRGPWLVFAAGLTTSLALFFKEQAAYMTLAAPLWLAYKAAQTRRWRPWLGQGLLYLCGGLVGGAIYVTPILMEGALAAHIQSRIRFGSVYLGDAPQGLGLLSIYLGRITGSRAMRLFFLAWFWCFAQGGRALWRLRSRPGRGGGARSDRELLAILYVGAATTVVQMGRQFFLHYFLFFIPFAFIVMGYAIHALARLFAHRRAGGAVAVMIALVALAVIQFYPPNPYAWPAAGVAAILALAAWARFSRPIRPRRLVGAVSILMALLAAAAGGALVNRRAAASVDQNAICPCFETREFFARHGHPSTDRLFVWGWRPEFYCASGLEPANCYITCAGVLKGFWFATAIDEAAAAELMAELHRNPPRFIVCGLPDVTDLVRSLYPLHTFPALERWVRSEYRPAVMLPDCEIYERKASPQTAAQK